MNDSVTVEDFVKDYIDAWGTENSISRQELVSKLYADTATFYSNGLDGSVICHGIADIASNIAQVNEHLVKAKGLSTELAGSAVNHDALRVSWRMMTPDGNPAMTGMNVLFRDATGKISRDYIFIG